MTPEPQQAPVRPRRRRSAREAPEPPKTNGRAPHEDPPRIDEVDRLAPWSQEAEQSVLGSILIDESCLAPVDSLIEPASFYRAQHTEIYDAMLALRRSATPVDLVTLGVELARRRKLESVGGRAYLASLMNAVPTAVHAEHYGRIVAMKALARRAIIDAGRIAAMGYEDSNDPEELLGRLRSVVEGIQESWRATVQVPIEELLGARLLNVVPTDAPPPLLIGRLDPMGHTILYGTGGVGKGTLSSSWIVGLLNEEKRVLIVDYENHPDEWARRIHGLGAGDLMDRVLHVAPLTAAWGGKRGAIWVQAEDLHELAIDFRADYMLVDSIVPACAGSDPLKPEAVSQYAGALEYIGLPALSLGHVTKADDLRYPFGSIFWHNLSRTTFSLKADSGAVILTHRKRNNYALVPAQKVEVTWSEAGVPTDVWERSYAEDLSRRISEVLIGSTDGLAVKQIVAGLHELNPDDEADPPAADTVSKALRRGARAKPPKFVKEGSDRWRNA